MICPQCGEAMTHFGLLQSSTVDLTPPAERAQLYQCCHGHWLAMSGGAGGWIPEPISAPVTLLPAVGVAPDLGGSAMTASADPQSEARRPTYSRPTRPGVG